MLEHTLEPTTKRREMPRELSEKQINALVATTYYPAHFYCAAIGVQKLNIALSDYERGIIDPDEVRFRGLYRPFQKRGVGQKAMIMIRGREIRRIYREGRAIGRYMQALTRLKERDAE